MSTLFISTNDRFIRCFGNYEYKAVVLSNSKSSTIMIVAEKLSK